LRNWKLSYKPLVLGREKLTSRPIFMQEKIRAEHMHVIGSTGTGKSKFLEWIIRQDIVNGDGLCLIDPHGTLYDDIVKWCVSEKCFKDRKIILLDPTDDKWSFGFNPLSNLTKENQITFLTDAMVKACAMVFGGENIDQTPRLAKCLSAILHALIENKLSLAEARYLTNPSNPIVREYLTQDIKNEAVRDLWSDLNKMKPREFRDQFESTINRLDRFLKHEVITNILGQTSYTLNFKEIMDSGAIVLVNLSHRNRKLSMENSRLLGTLIINDLFLSAFDRQEGKSRPFYLYVDECSRYVNEDIENILTQTRKFGLHAILSHQTLEQLKLEGNERVYEAVMGCARTKVVFGGLSAKEAKIMGEELYTGYIDLEEPIKILNKPVVVDYDIVELESWSSSHSTMAGDSFSESSGVSRGESQSDSEGFSTSDPILLGDGTIFNQSTSSGSSTVYISTSGRSRTNAAGHSESHGRHQALKPILEEKPSAVYSPDAQMYKMGAAVKNQPQQQAIVKFRSDQPICFIVPTVKDVYVRESRVKDNKEQNLLTSHYARQKPAIESEIKTRWQQLEHQAQEALTPLQKGKKGDTIILSNDTDEQETFREKRIKIKKI